MDTPETTSKEYPTSDEELGYSPFHARLVILADQFRSVRSYATAAGISQGGLQRLLNGGEPTLSTLISLAHASDVTVEWLATGRGKWPPHIPKPADGVAACVREAGPSYDDEGSSALVFDTLGRLVDTEEFVFIPRYDIRITAGHGAVWPGHEEVKDVLAFRRDWISNALPDVTPENLVAANIDGDSQAPTLLHRDMILIDRGDTTSAERFFVLNLNDGVMVKRLQRLPGGGVNILSDNPAFPPITLTAEQASQDVVINGCIRWFARTI